MAKLTAARAEQIIQRAQEKAAEMGVTVCIAVVDAGAHLTAFKRMDGVILAAVDVAQRKARTSILIPIDSGAFGELIREKQLQGFELSNGGMVGFPGGLPIFEEGEPIGGVGVSGATAEQDREIAQYAIEASE